MIAPVTKDMLSDFFKEMIFLFGTDYEKKFYMEPKNWDMLFKLWLEILEDNQVRENTFRKRWKAIKSQYGKEKQHFGIPKPAHFLSVEIPKEIEAYEQPKPMSEEEKRKTDEARERALEKMRNLTKQS